MKANEVVAKLVMNLVAGSVLGWAVASNAAWAQAKMDVGKREFEANCASCHGMDGKGRGPLVELLRKSPPDLTQLSKASQGVFPMNWLYTTIEGENVAAHGSRDMPVWGRDYRIKDAEYFMDSPYDAQGLVRARILSLLEYIYRFQTR